MPSLAGAYIYTDWCTGQIWALRYDYENQEIIEQGMVVGTGMQIPSFGEDEQGNMYILAMRSGPNIYRLVDPNGPTCNGKPATIIGTDARDILIGTIGHDVISGRGGDDLIFGMGGPDFICGGAGDDLIFGGAGNDWMAGEDGNDLMVGQAGSDLLIGGPGDDLLVGGEGDDVFHCGAGIDTVYGGPDVIGDVAFPNCERQFNIP